jgi:hypothetical protein
MHASMGYPCSGQPGGAITTDRFGFSGKIDKYMSPGDERDQYEDSQYPSSDYPDFLFSFYF